LASVVPPPTEPEAFVRIDAVDDTLSASESRVIVEVLANDIVGDEARIVSVGQPEIGSATIDNGRLVVDVPRSYGGEVSFTYTISDQSGVASTATVRLISVNVLSVVNDLVETESPIDSPGEAFQQVASVFGGLIDVRLSAIHLTALATAPLFLGAIVLLLGRRESLMSVTNVSWPRTVDFQSDAGSGTLRHDAVVWSTRKNRKSAVGGKQTRVVLASGERGWIDVDLLTDTGY